MAKLSFSFLLFVACFCAEAQTGTVILLVKGIQVAKGGELSAGIFKEASFPKVGQQWVGKEVSVSAEQMQIVFNSVPAGTYGIVVFQDIDRDKNLKTNFVGLPKEPIGFSRDAKIKFGPPEFDDAKVELLPGKTLTLSITLK